MSRKPTKGDLQRKVDELQELNLGLSKALKMVEDGQWVVITASDLRRYQSGIDRLIVAGDGMHAHFSNPDNPELDHDCLALWRAAKSSDRF